MLISAFSSVHYCAKVQLQRPNHLYSTDGVCKDILTVAGPQVEAELKAGEKRGPERNVHAKHT